MSLAVAKKVWAKGFLLGLKPDEILTVSEWAQKHRHLSQKASAEPGKWDNARTPYLVEIMDCLSNNSIVEEVYFCKGAQVGGTEAGNNFIGYVIDYSPGPMMAVMPRMEDAKRNSKIRIQPLIEETPRLKEKVAAAKSRDSGNTQLQKEFPGGVLVMTGANSAPGLRSMPARYMFFDEEDAYPVDVDGEGDPVALGKARTRTFSKKKIFHVSTPTTEHTSRIEPGYMNSDRRKYFVPCPHCKHKQELVFENLIYDKNDLNNVTYRCANDQCGALIEEYEKTWMLKEGEWRATNPDWKDKKVRGYHLNSLYSPLGWMSWSDIAKEWQAALGNEEKLKAFTNTIKGETWKERGDAPDWKRLYERRSKYKIGTVPEKGVFLTMGVDVQRDRLECEVVAWGRNAISYSVNYIVIPGDTSKKETWNELDKLISTTFEKEIKGKKHYLPIKLTAIDSGYNSQEVYNFVRKYPPNKVIAIKGSDSLSTIFSPPKPVDVTTGGRRIRRGLQLWMIGSSVIKSQLYGWLRQDTPIENENDPVGFCRFPEYGPEYFKMLTAEQLVAKINKKKRTRSYEWHKIRERNEALDCRVMARAAASIIGMDRFQQIHWEELERGVGLCQSNNNPKKPQASKPPERKRRKGNWLRR